MADTVEDASPKNKHCFIPKRYILVTMCCLAVCICASSRESFAKTLLLVSHKKIENNTKDDPDACKVMESSTIKPVPEDMILYPNWDEQTRLLIENTFYLGYVVSHVPGGALADQHGGKYVLVYTVLGMSCATLLTPMIIKNCNGQSFILIITRIVGGLFEGPLLPSISALVGLWIPAREKTTTCSLIFSNVQFAIFVTGYIRDAFIANSNDWAAIFYITGSSGIVWCVIWHFLCYSKPASHPTINEREKKMLSETIDTWNESKGKKKIPWKHFWTSGPFWAIYCTQIALNWAWLIVMFKLPRYLKKYLKYQSARWDSVHLFMIWASTLAGGILFDYLVNKRILDVTTGRKIFNNFGSMGTGIFTVAATYTSCNKISGPSLMVVAMFQMGIYANVMEANTMDLAPNFGGTSMGFANGAGVLGAFVAFFFSKYVAANDTLAEWRTVFWISLLVYVFANIIYSIFGSGKAEPWNNAPPD